MSDFKFIVEFTVFSIPSWDVKELDIDHELAEYPYI